GLRVRDTSARSRLPQPRSAAPSRWLHGRRPRGSLSVRMPIDVTMPQLSDTMEEGKILKWLKRPGEPVAIGEIIAEVETDKANMELEAYDEGTLAEVRVQEGDSAPVGAVIAVLAAPGEGTTARPAAHEKAAPTARAPASAPRAAAPAKAEAGREPFRPTVVRRPEPVESPGAAASVKASPLARRIAHDHDLDLAQVTGTGPGGRIVQKDVEAALAARGGPPLRPRAARGDRAPGARAPRAGAQRALRVGRPDRRHLHPLQPRHAAGHGVHGGDQPAAGGDPGRGHDPRDAGRARGPDRPRAEYDGHRLVRSPYHRRHARRALPPRAEGAAREPARARPVTGAADYDLVVLGAGPGGYVAAIRAAQLGLRTAVVERDRPGGVCGNWGCIPSKAILADAALFAEVKGGARRGILADNLRVDYPRVVARSREVADRQAKGVEFLFKKNGIAYHHGVGRLVRGGVAIGADGERGEMLAARYVLLATGSRERSLPGLEIDAGPVLVAVGRARLSDDLGLADVGVRTERGFVVVDANMRTSADGVYAIGDLVGPLLLAHAASEQGVVAVETMAGRRRDGDGVEAADVPICVYSQPEVAAVGLTEAEAKKRGHEVRVGKF